MKTADIIRTARTEFGWTQAKLAKEANISRQEISRIESGESLNMTAQTAIQIAKALGISLDYLLCLER